MRRSGYTRGVCVLLAVCAASAQAQAELSVESSRADMVSGGDALVRWSAPTHSRGTVWLEGREVTSSFGVLAFEEKKPSSAGRLGASRQRYTRDRLAVLTGLTPGPNRLEVRANGEVRSALTLVNHSASGPVLAGPRHDTYICQTQANGLGPALDRDCSVRTRVSYYYKSTAAPPSTGWDAMVASFSRGPGALDEGFKPFDPAGPPPADVARIRTASGCEARYIVRREVGTINRAVYDIQFLHDPADPLPSPWTRAGCAWNGRLVYLFGGGRGGGYHQGVLGAVGRAQEGLLSQGFAVATASLNVWETNGDDRVSAETLSMVKEHFTKFFGRPVHTIGWGSSGGALQQYLIVQNYPGLLDGIIPSLSFPDWISSAQTISDCALLANYFDHSSLQWTEAQKTAVSGFATWRTCIGWRRDWSLADPRGEYCDSSLPARLIYDPARNPSGLRCDYYSNLKNVLGVDPVSGRVRRPLDNVGVQYGLAAYNAGTIDAEQFLALNENIGGVDADGRITRQRTQADPESVRVAYERGLVLTGGGGLRETPIIDWRQYSDDLSDVHDSLRSRVTRARLMAASGSADNQIILTDPRPDPYPPDTRYVERQRELVAHMEAWLTRIDADDAPGTQLDKIARNRPASLAEGCWTTKGERIVDAERCREIYPTHADPRIVAGGPLTDDVLKCALKPIDAADYSRAFTAPQMARLNALFPAGVCDYKRPGIGQQITVTTWQRF